ncbi:MAG: NTP transferase domain-containing protein [Gammaproteobacteria bacterium WSBS_2016_MAG_OTU1]
MKFITLKTEDAVGCVLAHSGKLAGKKIAKGRVLSQDDITALQHAKVRHVAVAKLETGDMDENTAATTIAKAASGDGTHCDKTKHGRTNLYADCDGVLTYTAATLNNTNQICSAIALAALPPFFRVAAGQMICTVKIIPFALPEKFVSDAAQYKKTFTVHPFVKQNIILIQTTLPDTAEAMLDKTTLITGQRLQERNNDIKKEIRCVHRRKDIAAAIKSAMRDKPALLLLAGASAACDVGDEIPAAIVDVGGKIEHFGMPVDPGNLLALAKIDNTQCVVLPGCARSIKNNGFDWVLDRLLANIHLSSQEISAMGVGGLLDDTTARPMRRQPPTKPKIGIILLAAGMSKRMGKTNKLLASWRDMPLVLHSAKIAAAAVKQNIAKRAVVVCGQDAEKISAAIADTNLSASINPQYACGMATSLSSGLLALAADELDGVLIMLGDMPNITLRDIRAIVAAFHSTDDIVAPTYHQKRGNPVLIGRRHFNALRQLQGDVGARVLFADHAIIETPAGAGVLFDIDSAAELKSNP